MQVQLIVVLQVLTLTWCAQDTGYPAGMMSDCPGMNRTTELSEDTRKGLFVLVKWPSEKAFSSNEKKCKLSVGGAACAAKYLNLRKRKTVVIISGYMDASFSPYVRMTYQSYIERGYNAIVVEIFPIFVRSYPVAARVTKPLGNLVGEFLAELTHLGLSPKHMEMVGGSLGAHTASYASERYFQLTGSKPARLTGLDPAGPCFRNLGARDRFHAQAAERVDALHTNIDGFGIADTVAQVDFYANGGEYQQNIIGDFILPCFQFCSHVRSAVYWYFAALHKDEFIATKCDSVAKARHGDCYNEHLETNVLGPKTNFSRSGIYYLPTMENMPYYMGHNGLKQRKYVMNDYLLRSAPDVDMVV